MTFIRPEVKGSEWKLTKHEFYTAYHFALQYKELKDKYNSMLGLSAINMDGMPHGNSTTDPTSQQAIKLDQVSRKIKLIEDTAREVDPTLYCWLLKGVTDENISYTYLQQIMNIPCGKNVYYNCRRKYYYLLNKKMQEI